MRSIGSWKKYCERNGIRFLDSEIIEKKIINCMTKGKDQGKSQQSIFKEVTEQLEVSKEELKQKWHGENDYRPLKLEWEIYYSNRKKQMFFKDVYKEISIQLNHYTNALKLNKTPVRRLKLDSLVSNYKGYIPEEIIISVVNESFILMKKQNCTIDSVKEVYQKRMNEYDSYLINQLRK